MARRKVPVMRQDSELECGATCLAMVLGYYGRDVTVAECHERCNVGRDGQTALDIAKAARTYGLQVIPYTVELDDLANVPCPAVIHWGFKHFVVLERSTDRGAVIVDPGRGRIKVDRDELDREFTGVVLAMAPGSAFDEREPEEERPSHWRLLARRAFSAPGARRLLVQIVLASLLLQALGLAVPGLTKVLVDSVLPLQIDDIMPILAAGIALILLTQLITSYLRSLLLVSLQARLDAQLMTGFFEHVLSLPYQFFMERSSGDLIQRLSSNAQIRNVLSNQTVSALLDGLLVIVYAVILVAVEPMFGLVAVSLGVIQIGLLVVTTRRITALTTQELEEVARSQGFMVETLAGIGSLKAAGVEDRTLSHWTGLLGSQLEASMRRGRLTAAIASVTSTIQRFAPLILLWIGAQAVLDGSMALGSMLALVSLAQNFLTPLSSVVIAGQQFQQVGGHLERIATVLAAEPEQDLHKVAVAPRLLGEVEFRDVSFRYDKSSPWAVRRFSLTIEPGQRVALVGRSGSGKTTLAKIMLGLYEPEEGAILFDGRDLREFDRRTVRTQCGVVMQEATVFNGSIRRNISYHDPSMPLEAIERAARLADLDSDIRRMPMGYETVVAEGGSALSGGQRQRLAIARALAHDPRVLVFDEATSSLDMASESVVGEALDRHGATMLVIAHRLSTVRNSDLILVFDRGEVVERGTHDELMLEDGFYAELVRDQMVDEPAAV